MSGAVRVARNTIWLFGSKSWMMMLTFGFFVFAARFLGAAGLGQFSLLKGYFELFVSLAASALTTVLVREIAARPGQARKLISSAAAVAVPLALTGGAVLYGLAVLLDYSGQTRALTLIVGMALVPASLSLLLESVFVAFERGSLVATITLTETTLRTGLSVLALLAGYGVAALLAVLLLTRTLMLLHGILLIRRHLGRVRPHFHAKTTRSLLLKWRTFAVENWTTDLFWSLDIVLLSVLLGETAVGIYSAAYRLINAVWVVGVSFVRAIYPFLTRLYYSAPERYLQVTRQTFSVLVLLAIPAVVLGAHVSPQLISLLYGQEDLAAAPVLAILLGVAAFRLVNPFLSFALFAQGRQLASLRASLLSLLVYVPLLWLFTRAWGEAGTAGALLAASAVAAAGYAIQLFGPGMRAQVAQQVMRSLAAGVLTFALLQGLNILPLTLRLLLTTLAYALLLLALGLVTPAQLRAGAGAVGRTTQRAFHAGKEGAQ